MAEPVRIPCPCPPLAGGEPRHPGGDTVELKETLDFRSVTAIRANIGLLEDGSDVADVMAVLTEGYLLHGIAAWSLTDERGKPLPVSRLTIAGQLLTDVAAASIVGDAADEVFGEKVMLPLVSRAENSSPPTPTEPTSAPKADSTPSSARPPRRSKPSSTTTTPMAATAKTFSSPGGAYSSSQNSASEA